MSCDVVELHYLNVYVFSTYSRCHRLDIILLAGPGSRNPESTYFLGQRQEGQPISLGSFAVKGTGERDFLTFLATCRRLTVLF